MSEVTGSVDREVSCAECVHVVRLNRLPEAVIFHGGYFTPRQPATGRADIDEWMLLSISRGETFLLSSGSYLAS